MTDLIVHKVVVNNQPAIIHKVIVNNQAGVLAPTTQIGIKNELGQTIAISSVDQLIDVDITQKTANATLVYNASTMKYEVRPMTFEDIGILDGGTY